MNFLARFQALPHVVRHTPDIDNLLNHLQIALELELSTLPPYMCALYSIQDGSNVEAAGLIRSVLMEEMLHVLLVANVINSIGGSPKLTGPRVVPHYPTVLPDCDGSFVVSLQKFSPEAIAMFQRIELPAPDAIHPQTDHYHTIGQFYEAIGISLQELSDRGEIEFKYNPERQVTPADYYNGHGNVIVVNSCNTALKALSEITDQGEGVSGNIMEGNEPFDAIGYDLAHYFRFTEIALGRRYQANDTPQGGPTGALFPVDWSAVKNMISNPRAGWFTPGDPVRRRMDDCNAVYFLMLGTLEDALNGRGKSIADAVPLMLELKHRATELMNIPSGIADTMLGPSFELPSEITC